MNMKKKQLTLLLSGSVKHLTAFNGRFDDKTQKNDENCMINLCTTIEIESSEQQKNEMTL